MLLAILEAIRSKLVLTRQVPANGFSPDNAAQSKGPFSEVVLGEQAHLSHFGVHMERLPPGSRSSFRHWHEAEDEFLYVLQGEVVQLVVVGTRGTRDVVHYPDHGIVMRRDGKDRRFQRADGTPIPDDAGG